MTLRTSAVCLLILVPSLAAAAPNLEEAKQHFAAGKQAFERGEYEAALAEFQKANEIAPAPSLLYNMGKTYEALGRFKDAAYAFDRYLQDYGAPQNDEDKQFQENLRARYLARIATFLDTLKTACFERDISYNLANTKEPYDQFLAAYHSVNPQ